MRQRRPFWGGPGAAGGGPSPANRLPTILWLPMTILTTALLLAWSGSSGAQAPSVSSPSAVLMEAHTGRVLYAKNEHEPRAPASVTKVFTLVMALEALQDGRVALDDMVVTSRRAA